MFPARTPNGAPQCQGMRLSVLVSTDGSFMAKFSGSQASDR
jgi:hypothetical protein